MLRWTKYNNIICIAQGLAMSESIMGAILALSPYFQRMSYLLLNSTTPSNTMNTKYFSYISNCSVMLCSLVPTNQFLINYSFFLCHFLTNIFKIGPTIKTICQRQSLNNTQLFPANQNKIWVLHYPHIFSLLCKTRRRSPVDRRHSNRLSFTNRQNPTL